MRKRIPWVFLFTKKEFLMFLLFFIFSSFLMWKTFRVDGKENLQIASKLWSDFAATFPLIRSFSYGENFPPQYPIFPGPPIRYHFLFFLLVGLLEKAGIPLDWTFNTLSAFSLALLLILIYLLAKAVFEDKVVGALATALFLFNGSLSFVEFFKKYPLSPATPDNILTNTNFPSFGPYDGKVVSAFWNLNIYTNQRHLALAYAGFLLLIFFLYNWAKKPESFTIRKSILVGVLVGIFPFMHMAVFGMMGIALATFLLIYPKIRWKIFIIGAVAGILAGPQILYMGSSQVEVFFFTPGYLAGAKSLVFFFKYWLFNLGLVSILAPAGFVLANKDQRKIFLPFIVLFIVGNLFQFSPEISANHKFFNLFLLGASIFTAYFLFHLWKITFIGKALSLVLFFFLTLSGIIDLFPIINDSNMQILDIPNNRAAAYIERVTPRNAVFLNSLFLYDPASIAGRKIFLGWPYFSWSAGYDTSSRFNEMESLLSPTDKNQLCESLKERGIDFIETQKPSELEGILPDYSFFEKKFHRIYYDQVQEFSIYDVKLSCRF